ncbi:Alpha/Beta hydrolase protein [Aspergillus heterothallicus]
MTPTQISAISSLYPNDPSVGIPLAYVGIPPEVPYGLQFKRVAAFAGDYQQHAGRRLLVETYAQTGLAVYSYLWNVLVNGIPSSIYGATHFQEVAFVFNNVDGIGYAADPFANKPRSYVELADLMSKMWVHFAHDADPNFDGAALEWPKYLPGNATNLVFDTDYPRLGYVAQDNYRAEEISYLQDYVFV